MKLLFVIFGLVLLQRYSIIARQNGPRRSNRVALRESEPIQGGRTMYGHNYWWWKDWFSQQWNKGMGVSTPVYTPPQPVYQPPAPVYTPPQPVYKPPEPAPEPTNTSPAPMPPAPPDEPEPSDTPDKPGNGPDTPGPATEQLDAQDGHPHRPQPLITPHKSGKQPQSTAESSDNPNTSGIRPHRPISPVNKTFYTTKENIIVDINMKKAEQIIEGKNKTTIYITTNIRDKGNMYKQDETPFTMQIDIDDTKDGEVNIGQMKDDSGNSVGANITIETFEKGEGKEPNVGVKITDSNKYSKSRGKLNVIVHVKTNETQGIAREKDKINLNIEVAKEREKTVNVTKFEENGGRVVEVNLEVKTKVNNGKWATVKIEISVEETEVMVFGKVKHVLRIEIKMETKQTNKHYRPGKHPYRPRPNNPSSPLGKPFYTTKENIVVDINIKKTEQIIEGHNKTTFYLATNIRDEGNVYKQDETPLQMQIDVDDTKDGDINIGQMKDDSGNSVVSNITINMYEKGEGKEPNVGVKITDSNKYSKSRGKLNVIVYVKTNETQGMATEKDKIHLNIEVVKERGKTVKTTKLEEKGGRIVEVNLEVKNKVYNGRWVTVKVEILVKQIEVFVSGKTKHALYIEINMKKANSDVNSSTNNYRPRQRPHRPRPIVHYWLEKLPLRPGRIKYDWPEVRPNRPRPDQYYRPGTRPLTPRPIEHCRPGKHHPIKYDWPGVTPTRPRPSQYKKPGTRPNEHYRPGKHHSIKYEWPGVTPTGPRPNQCKKPGTRPNEHYRPGKHHPNKYEWPGVTPTKPRPSQYKKPGTRPNKHYRPGKHHPNKYEWPGVTPTRPRPNQCKKAGSRPHTPRPNGHNMPGKRPNRPEQYNSPGTIYSTKQNIMVDIDINTASKVTEGVNKTTINLDVNVKNIAHKSKQDETPFQMQIDVDDTKDGDINIGQMKDNVGNSVGANITIHTFEKGEGKAPSVGVKITDSKKYSESNGELNVIVDVKNDETQGIGNKKDKIHLNIEVAKEKGNTVKATKFEEKGGRIVGVDLEVKIKVNNGKWATVKIEVLVKEMEVMVNGKVKHALCIEINMKQSNSDVTSITNNYRPVQRPNRPNHYYRPGTRPPSFRPNEHSKTGIRPLSPRPNGNGTIYTMKQNIMFDIDINTSNKITEGVNRTTINLDVNIKNIGPQYIKDKTPFKMQIDVDDTKDGEINIGQIKNNAGNSIGANITIHTFDKGTGKKLNVDVRITSSNKYSKSRGKLNIIVDVKPKEIQSIGIAKDKINLNIEVAKEKGNTVKATKFKEKGGRIVGVDLDVRTKVNNGKWATVKIDILVKEMEVMVNEKVKHALCIEINMKQSNSDITSSNNNYRPGQRPRRPSPNMQYRPGRPPYRPNNPSSPVGETFYTTTENIIVDINMKKTEEIIEGKNKTTFYLTTTIRDKGNKYKQDETPFKMRIDVDDTKDGDINIGQMKDDSGNSVGAKITIETFEKVEGKEPNVGVKITDSNKYSKSRGKLNVIAYVNTNETQGIARGKDKINLNIEVAKEKGKTVKATKFQEKGGRIVRVYLEVITKVKNGKWAAVKIEILVKQIEVFVIGKIKQALYVELNMKQSNSDVTGSININILGQRPNRPRPNNYHWPGVRPRPNQFKLPGTRPYRPRPNKYHWPGARPNKPRPNKDHWPEVRPNSHRPHQYKWSGTRPHRPRPNKYHWPGVRPNSPRPKKDHWPGLRPNSPRPNQYKWSGTRPHRPRPNKYHFSGVRPNRPRPKKDHWPGLLPNSPRPNQHKWSGTRPHRPRPNKYRWPGVRPNRPDQYNRPGTIYTTKQNIMVDIDINTANKITGGVNKTTINLDVNIKNNGHRYKQVKTPFKMQIDVDDAKDGDINIGQIKDDSGKSVGANITIHTFEKFKGMAQNVGFKITDSNKYSKTRGKLNVIVYVWPNETQGLVKDKINLNIDVAKEKGNTVKATKFKEKGGKIVGVDLEVNTKVNKGKWASVKIEILVKQTEVSVNGIVKHALCIEIKMRQSNTGVTSLTDNYRPVKPPLKPRPFEANDSVNGPSKNKMENIIVDVSINKTVKITGGVNKTTCNLAFNIKNKVDRNRQDITPLKIKIDVDDTKDGDVNIENMKGNSRGVNITIQMFETDEGKKPYVGVNIADSNRYSKIKGKLNVGVYVKGKGTHGIGKQKDKINLNIEVTKKIGNTLKTKRFEGKGGKIIGVDLEVKTKVIEGKWATVTLETLVKEIEVIVNGKVMHVLCIEITMTQSETVV